MNMVAALVTTLCPLLSRSLFVVLVATWLMCSPLLPRSLFVVLVRSFAHNDVTQLLMVQVHVARAR